MSLGTVVDPGELQIGDPDFELQCKLNSAVLGIRHLTVLVHGFDLYVP